MATCSTRARNWRTVCWLYNIQEAETTIKCANSRFGSRIFLVGLHRFCVRQHWPAVGVLAPGWPMLRVCLYLAFTANSMYELGEGPLVLRASIAWQLAVFHKRFSTCTFIMTALLIMVRCNKCCILPKGLALRLLPYVRPPRFLRARGFEAWTEGRRDRRPVHQRQLFAYLKRGLSIPSHPMSELNERF